jgi:hypothetical protein
VVATCPEPHPLIKSDHPIAEEKNVNMTPVTSDTVHSVGYDYSTQVLRVLFKSGRTYEYYGVPGHLYELMLLPHPWRRVGRQVRAYRYLEVAA